MENKSFTSKLMGANALIIFIVFGTFAIVYHFLNHQLANNLEQRRQIAQLRLSTEHVATNLYQAAMLNDAVHLSTASLESNKALTLINRLTQSGIDTASIEKLYYDFFRYTVITTSLALENRTEDALTADDISHQKYIALAQELVFIRNTIDIKQSEIINAITLLMIVSALLLLTVVVANVILLYRSFQSISNQENERAEMISALGDGVYGVDDNGKCIFINSAALSLLGFEKGEVLGLDQHLLFHHSKPSGEHYPHHQCPIRHTLSDRQVRNTDETFIRKDGTFLPVNLTAAPLGKNRVIVVFKDITDLKNEQERLHIHANYDQLTSLPNRRLFTILAEQMIAKSQRDHKPLSVAFLDLDGFKAINDTYGHEVGDSVLQEIAIRFKNVLRQSDIIARFGGDEFVVLLNSIEHENDVIQSLKRLVEQASLPITVEKLTLHIGVSIGYTLVDNHETEIDTLIRYADMAMYNAKQSGKGKICRYQNQ